MNKMLLTEIEQRVTQLSSEERLWLIEHIAHTLRENNDVDDIDTQRELEEMANDPEIQRELQAINAEFAITEMDGLGKL